jgi:hypothetical protein
VKKFLVGWSSAVRPSRQPLRGFLRMRTFLNAMKDLPHSAERPTDQFLCNSADGPFKSPDRPPKFRCFAA